MTVIAQTPTISPTAHAAITRNPNVNGALKKTHGQSAHVKAVTKNTIKKAPAITCNWLLPTIKTVGNTKIPNRYFQYRVQATEKLNLSVLIIGSKNTTYPGYQFSPISAGVMGGFDPADKVGPDLRPGTLLNQPCPKVRDLCHAL
jgi:hypothetical protein